MPTFSCHYYYQVVACRNCNAVEVDPMCSYLSNYLFDNAIKAVLRPISQGIIKYTLIFFYMSKLSKLGEKYAKRHFIFVTNFK